jgi:hypothetical protein
MNTRRRKLNGLGLIGVVGAIAAIAAGCGDETAGPMQPDPPAAPVLGDFPPGSYVMTVDEGTAPLELLEGKWTMKIEADGDLTISHQAGAVFAEVRVTGNEFTLRDIGGALACEAPTTVGTYAWSETATSVSFSALSDGCDGRRFVLMYAPWTRE